MKIDLDDGANTLPKGKRQARSEEDSDEESAIGSVLSNPSGNKRAQGSLQGLEDAIREQSATIAAAMKASIGSQPENDYRRSAVKVTPTIRWPLLTDDGPDSKDVEELYVREI